MPAKRKLQCPEVFPFVPVTPLPVEPEVIEPEPDVIPPTPALSAKAEEAPVSAPSVDISDKSTQPKRKYVRKEVPLQVVPKCVVCETLHRGGYKRLVIDFGVIEPTKEPVGPIKAFQCPACMAAAFGWNPPKITMDWS